VNAGTTQTNRLQFGENSATIITAARFTKVVWDNASSTLPGPYFSPPPSLAMIAQR
jgi:hypothetical protein